MEQIKKILYKMSPKFREKMFYLKFAKNPIRKLNQIKEIKKIHKGDLEEYKALKNLILKTDDGYDFAKEFCNAQFIMEKDGKIIEKSPILVCLVKDDLIRIKKFLQYYKELGVENFIFIDNNSTDGTFELLLNQENVVVYRCTEKYTTIRRQAWIAKIMSIYGTNKWYLVLDSDEFLSYEGCEKHSIQDFIKYLEKINIKRAKTLTIDMYSDGLLFDNTEVDDFESKYNYFDIDTYEKQEHLRFELICGGMRKRIFGKTKSISPFLVKYPLIFFEKGDLQYNSHFSYPFYKNFNQELIGVLRHYKFMGNDISKIKERAKNKNYAYGSVEYISYLETYNKNPNISAYYEKSIKYKDSNDFKQIKGIHSIDWRLIDGN